MAEQTGSSPMFAIFVLSLLSLALIPYTIYRFTSEGEAGDVVKPWQAKGKRKPSLAEWFQQVLTRGNIILLCLWVVWGLILLYTQYSATDMKPFDPYEILNLQPGASSAEIKRQYRKLAMEFHPDKNPDPAASKYFAEYITKAHTALTDETARKNYEKYGHPDGPQALDIGIALPEWIFSKDRNTAPLVLGGLVGLGILLPLGIASWYLLRSNKLVGPNNIMYETVEIYAKSALGVKESQGLSRIPDTLVVAMEFITMPTPADQQMPLEELRKIVLRLHPELKDKNLFWNRKTPVKKVHMLLLAYLGRKEIPTVFDKDLKFVLEKSPVFLEEMVKIAQIPRHPQQMFGWYEPTKAAIQMCQCIVQAMTVDVRKSMRASKGPADNVIPLLQLPHFDQDLLKRIGRRKVKTLQDMFTMPSAERKEVCAFGGLTASQTEEVETSLMAMPTVHMAAKCVVDGEDSEDIMESDIVTCAARVVLTRHSHLAPDAQRTTHFQVRHLLCCSDATAREGPKDSASVYAERLLMRYDYLGCKYRDMCSVHLTGFSPDSIKGNGVQAYAPIYLGTKMEKWNFILCDPNLNQVWTVQPTALVEAERKGAELAQKLARGELLSSSGAPLTDATNISVRNNNGHKETEASSSVLSNPKALNLIQQHLEGEQPKSEASGNNGTSGNGSSQALVTATTTQSESEGQLVEVKFRAVKAGRYNLQLQCMSDSWVGCDVSIPVTFKVSEMSKSDREGRTHRGKPLPLENEERSEGEEEGEEDEEGGEYDSEESGTEESGAGDDDEDAASEGSNDE